MRKMQPDVVLGQPVNKCANEFLNLLQMFQSVNPYQELVKERSRETDPENLIAEVEQLFRAEEETEQEIRNRLRIGLVPAVENLTTADLGEIFSTNQIKRTAINFRLRFLDARLFKGEFPYEAIRKVKELERIHGIRLSGFKVMAPVKMFSLVNPHADPLLFASVGKDKYLFIHRWGNDLSWYRKWLALPFRSFNTFLLFLVLLSALVNICIPSDVIAPMAKYKAEEYNIRAFLLIHFFLLLTAFSFFFFFKNGRGVSELEWNDKYSR